MQIDLSRFRDTFFQEADEHLARMESGLLELEGSSDSAELLNGIFRGAHSIKGAGGTFGFEDIARFTHALESLLDLMREGKVAADRERVDLLLKSVDVLRGLVEVERRGAAPPENAEEVRAQLIVAQRKSECAPDSVPEIRRGDAAEARTDAQWRVAFAPAPDVFRQGMDPALVLRELGRIGRVLETRLDLSRVPPLDQLDPETCYLAWELRLETSRTQSDIRDVFAFVEDGAIVSIEPASAAGVPAQDPAGDAGSAPGKTARAAARDGSSIRVATSKVDKLVDLVGELVIAQSMASTILDNFTPERLMPLREAFGDMERFTRELQERVMSVRMLPIGTVFSRFPRLVRDLAASTGKQAALDLIGADTELDKGVVEQLGDPLTHLIRNALDHGVEAPEERRNAGKPEQAVIRLEAFHQGGNVILEVSDDGRGLDCERIRRRAIERGLIADTDEATEREIRALIFAPGFSTAERVSDISGRGVGMDVVKRNVDALNGSVDLSSEIGRGTRVRIKLPLTLAILDGLLLKVGEETYILPLISILESIRPRPEQVRVIAGKGEVVVVRQEPLPLLRLHRLFGVPTQVLEPDRGLVVILEHQGKRLALLVDELLGQQQVVIKSLEAHFRKVEGVVGATILGDGRAALILDVAGLAAMARGVEPDRTAAA